MNLVRHTVGFTGLVLIIILFAVNLSNAQLLNGPEYEIYNDNSAISVSNSNLVDLLQTVTLNGALQGTNNDLAIKQIGSNNEIVNIQNFDNGAAFMNVVHQLGEQNKAYVKQTGASHQTRLLQNSAGVLGSEDPNFGNEANLWSEGFSTQNIAVQVGRNNAINQFVENYYAETRSVVSIQLGNDNKIEMALLDNGNNNLRGAIITQTGDANTAELVIESADVSYFKVNQSGGAEIKVTQTDFYFPMK